MRYLNVIIAISILLGTSNLVVGQVQEKEHGVSEKMPLFDGASNDQETQQKVFNYFQEKVANEEVNSDGTVIIRFLVDSTGTATDPIVVRSANSELDQYAIKYLNEMPKWEPAMKGNQKVAVQFTVPIRFKKAD
jgi:TonB family protein